MPGRTPPTRRSNHRRAQVAAAAALTLASVAFLGGRALLADPSPEPDEVAIS